MPFIFPPRYLPGLSDKWGRDVETRVNAVDKRLTMIEQNSNNSDRSTSGQLAITARQLNGLVEQVDELSARRTYSTTPADLQLIHGPNAGESGPVSRTVAFPAPTGGTRQAIIFGSGSVAWTGTSTSGGIGDSVTVGLEFRQSGTRRWYDNTQAGSALMFTFMGSDTFSIATPVVVPSGGSTYDIRMWVGKSSSGGQANAGARLENMNFSIVYGDKL